MKIALLQINPTVGDLARQRAADCRRRPRGGRARRRPRRHARTGARRLPAARSAAQRRLRRAKLEQLHDARARARDGLPPVLVGLPEPNPSDEGRPLFNTAALARGGTRRAALPQGAAAHLRRLRRGPLLRAVPRRADPRRSAAGGSASASARTSGTIATSGSGAAITTIRSRSSCAPAPRRSSTCRRRRSRPASTAGARRCSAAWRASIGVPIVVRQPVRRQRRPRLRRPQLRVQRRADAPIARGRSFDADVVDLRRRPGGRRSRRRRTSSSSPRSGARSCSARATTRASAASRGRCSGSRAASTRR